MVTALNEYDWIQGLEKRVDNAIKEEFYFEALFLLYALIDDRIKGICGHGKDADDKIKKDDKVTISSLLKKLYESSDPVDVSILSVSMSVATNAERNALDSIEYVRENYDSIVSGTKLYATHVAWDSPKNCPKGQRLGKSTHYSEVNIYSSVEMGRGRRVSATKLLEFVKGWVDERNHWTHAASADRLTDEQLSRQMRLLAIDGATLYYTLSRVSRVHKKGKKHGFSV